MPSFAFLDGNKTLISAAHDVPMKTSAVDFWLGPCYSGQVSVPASAAYVVVYTTDTTHQPLSATAERGAVWPVPASLGGTLKIAMSR